MTAAPASAPEYIIETRGLTREFNGFVAVRDVDLRVSPGHIHALIGPNGAGKTTCFNLLTKFLSPTRGQIFYQGADITRAAPASLARLGIVRSFQVSAVFPHLTVLENVRVALQRRLKSTFRFWEREATLAVLDAEATELLGSVDLASFTGTLAAELPYGRKRALELATTLAMQPKLMLLDEPTQGMGHEDVVARHRAHQVGSCGPHRADGRAQHERGGCHRGHDHGHAARPHHRKRTLCGGVAEPPGDRGVHGHHRAGAARMSAQALAVRDLHAYYGESHILHGVQFEVGAGEVVTLLGPQRGRTNDHAQGAHGPGRQPRRLRGDWRC